MHIKNTNIQLYESTYGGNFPLANYFLMEYNTIPKVLEFKDGFSEQLVEKLKSVSFLKLIHDHGTHTFNGKKDRYHKSELVFKPTELNPKTNNHMSYLLHVSHHSDEELCRPMLLYREKS